MKTLNKFILEHLECPKLSIIERLKLNKDTKISNNPKIDNIYHLCLLAFHKLIKISKEGHELIKGDTNKFLKNFGIDYKNVKKVFDMCVYDGDISEDEIDEIIKNAEKTYGYDLKACLAFLFFYLIFDIKKSNIDNDTFDRLYKKYM